MRFIGVLLILIGATVAYYMGVKGEDPATMTNQLFAFLKVSKPAPVLPAAVPAP